MSLSLAAIPAEPEDTLFAGVEREGDVFHLHARLSTSLSRCQAWHYLTDYEAAVNLPGVIRSTAARVDERTVQVERVADERILFLRIRLRSLLEFTEFPMERLHFTQLAGDSRAFTGEWRIVQDSTGSTLEFSGDWQPDSVIPLFIIDYFAAHDLETRFREVRRLAETYKQTHALACSV
ncbi:MAG: SRPBCC family protein [Pseudomonadota bacterium]